MEPQNDLLNNDLYVTSQAQEFLMTSSKWGKFLSIVGFISCVILLILGIFFSTMMSGSYQFSKLPMGGTFLGILYVIMGLLLFFPCLFLFRFSVKMKEALINSRQDSFENSLESLKSMFKFYGIVTIVVVGFYILVIIAVLIGIMVGH